MKIFRYMTPLIVNAFNTRMKNLILLFLLTFVVNAQKNDPAQELAAAERAFSAASEKFGIKASFLQFLSDDCVMFNPHPVNGKELYNNRPVSSAYLTWFPTVVEVSASGDFGISTGPWEYRKTKNDTTVSYGHYFSVWKKREDGSWNVALDNGISYSKTEKKIERDHFVNLPNHSINLKTKERAANEILESERAFARQIKLIGPPKAFTKFSSANLRVYRNGSFPTRNKKESLEFINKHPQVTADVIPLAAQVASSHDIGFIYGISIDAKNDSSSYVRIWRKEKDWKIAVDILVPFEKK